MKKLLSLLAVFFIAFAVVGCGGNNEVPEITPQQVSEKMANGETFIMVGSSTTCPHCHAYAPTLLEYKAEHPDLDVVKVQIDQINDQTTRSNFINAFVITGTPTTIVIRDGRMVASRAGNITLEDLTNFVNENLQ